MWFLRLLESLKDRSQNSHATTGLCMWTVSMCFLRSSSHPVSYSQVRHLYTMINWRLWQLLCKVSMWTRNSFAFSHTLSQIWHLNALGKQSWMCLKWLSKSFADVNDKVQSTQVKGRRLLSGGDRRSVAPSTWRGPGVLVRDLGWSIQAKR